MDFRLLIVMSSVQPLGQCLSFYWSVGSLFQATFFPFCREDGQSKVEEGLAALLKIILFVALSFVLNTGLADLVMVEGWSN